jgi:hypothetical protein
VTQSSPTVQMTRSKTGFSDLRSACLLLTGVSLAVWPLFAAVGYARSGWLGILAAILAAGVCWGGAVGSLLIAGVFLSTSQALSGVLLGMLFRMAVPLAACLILARSGGPLLPAGAAIMILLYYFITLIADTWLLLRLSADRPDGGVSRVS